MMRAIKCILVLRKPFFLEIKSWENYSLPDIIICIRHAFNGMSTLSRELQFRGRFVARGRMNANMQQNLRLKARHKVKVWKDNILRKVFDSCA